MLQITLSKTFPYKKHLFNIQNRAIWLFMPKYPLSIRWGNSFCWVVRAFYNSLYLPRWQPGWLVPPALLLPTPLARVPLPLASWKVVEFAAASLIRRSIHLLIHLYPTWLPWFQQCLLFVSQLRSLESHFSQLWTWSWIDCNLYLGTDRGLS